MCNAWEPTYGSTSRKGWRHILPTLFGLFLLFRLMSGLLSDQLIGKAVCILLERIAAGLIAAPVADLIYFQELIQFFDQQLLTFLLQTDAIGDN